MSEYETATERGHRALRDGGYHYSRGGDVAEDRAMIKSAVAQHENHEHGGEHTKLKLSKGGKIKGAKAGEHPGRRKRAAGGSVDDELKTGGGDYTPMKYRGPPHSSDTLDDEPPMKQRARGGSVTNEQHPPGDDEPSSRARGGRTNGKGGIGKVNIVIAHPGGGAPPMGSPVMPPHPPMAPPPMAAPPPHAPIMPPPGAMPGPGGPPPAPPAGMPMARPQGIRAGGPVRDVHGRFAGGGV